MDKGARKLAVVTGASTGIGFELARCCVEDGFDIVIAADEPKIHQAAETFRSHGAQVEAVEADLATLEGVDRLVDAAKALGRPIDVLIANAGRGLGDAFLNQDFEDARHVIDTNVTGTVYLIHRLGQDMRARGEGRILIVGSIAGFMPGSFQAVYNGSKAFLDSFSFAIRNELQDSGVTVTCLMPGPTDTEFFARADMLDTKVGQGKKDDPGLCRQGRLRGHDERGRGRRQRLEEQDPVRHGQCDAGRRPGGAAPQNGPARHRAALKSSGRDDAGLDGGAHHPHRSEAMIV
jgi:short-subunit dehydrogenase